MSAPIVPLPTTVIQPLSAPVDTDNFFMDFFQDFVPIPDLVDTFETTGITSLDITSIDTLLEEVLGCKISSLKIHEDGGLVAGCGGKLWLAGKLLSLYLIKHFKLVSKQDSKIRKIVELGSGTGVVGLTLGLLLKHQQDLVDDETKIYLTDLPQVISILEQNIESNELVKSCFADELDWFNTSSPPTYLVEDGEKVDLILVADCVYDVRLFDILIQTLVMLCNLNHKPQDPETIILFTFRKRRKSNARFFKSLKKLFFVEEIILYEGYEEFQKQRCHLFKLVIKRK